EKGPEELPKEDDSMAMQHQNNNDHNKRPGKRPRLMIDISPELRRRIKIAAVQKDLSIREYVEDILDQAVPTENSFLEKRERRSSSTATSRSARFGSLSPSSRWGWCS
ncbi:MAG TPA: hypothetical protein VIW78_00795, partial [Burkholderiales bacterium]